MFESWHGKSGVRAFLWCCLKVGAAGLASERTRTLYQEKIQDKGTAIDERLTQFSSQNFYTTHQKTTVEDDDRKTNTGERITYLETF